MPLFIHNAWDTNYGAYDTFQGFVPVNVELWHYSPSVGREGLSSIAYIISACVVLAPEWLGRTKFTCDANYVI
jgi:hypothetical protein